MARKNINAGQPNRVAQANRRENRRWKDLSHKQEYKGNSVLGPNSEHLIFTGPLQGELVEPPKVMVAA